MNKFLDSQHCRHCMKPIRLILTLAVSTRRIYQLGSSNVQHALPLGKEKVLCVPEHHSIFLAGEVSQMLPFAFNQHSDWGLPSCLSRQLSGRLGRRSSVVLSPQAVRFPEKTLKDP